MPQIDETERRAAQASGAPVEIRANAERLVTHYRQRLADAEHRAAIFEVALAEAREEAEETRQTVEALTARIDDLTADTAEAPSDLTDDDLDDV